MQLHSCRRWKRKMGGDLTEGMELLLLAWSEVGRGVTGWSRLWEEEEKVANERERLEGEEIEL